MIQPNRPDALGIFEDSRIAEVVDGFQQSRYADAVNRLVERLLFRQEVAGGTSARGKRRSKKNPQSRSNTLRVYLKSLERWSYYSVGVWGKEIDPRQVDTDVAVAYGKWLRGEGPGPDIRGMMVRALGSDFTALYEAVSRAGGLYGQVNLIQVVEAMEPSVRDKYVRVSTDPRVQTDYWMIHRMMGKLLRSFKNITRLPSCATIRAEEGRIWSVRERDPMSYTYTINAQAGLSTGGVATHLGALSAIWSEMTVRTSEDQPPLAFNPWKSVYSRWMLRSKAEKENARLRGEIPVLTTAIVRSMLNAARGADIEERRDTLAIMLALLGLRAEELVGLLRRDLVSVDGILNLAVLGKGNKVRQIPIYSDLRDCITLLTGVLEQESGETYVEDGERLSTYKAAYAAALLTEEAPLVPSLARWGCNQQDRDAEADAMESLDVSGFRAILVRLAEKARVREIATGVVRPLSSCDEDCKRRPCRHEMRRVHPHAFRHYAATSAQQAGVPLQDVQEILGHSDIRTTKGYIQVSPQKSMAFSAGVSRTLNRQPAMTPDEVEALRTKSMNPLEDKEIVEAEPEEARQTSAPTARARQAPDATRVVASPMWAYEGGESLKQYFPVVRGKPGNYISFANENKIAAGRAMEAIEESKAAGDSSAYASAVQQYMQIRSRYLWNTFRVGDVSRLPWWAGRKNTWKQGQMAPILSYAQIAPEDTEQSKIIDDLRLLHDQLYENQGPTAANAMIVWLTEITEIASTQFAKDMIERGDSWVTFEDEAVAGDTSIIREHASEPVLEWFETYAWAFRATISKSANNRGNIAIAAMDELPDWFWMPDPLLDLPPEERVQVKEWVTGLQGRRKSRVRFEQWIDQFSARIARWGSDRRWYEAGSGGTWQEGAADDTSARLTGRIKALRADFAAKVPSVKRMPDFEKLGEMKEAEGRRTLLSMLAEEGIDPANPSRSELGPAIGGRAGYLHPFDPGLMTFDLRSTIVHDEPTKRYWYERFGSDSECVVRRSVRALWERRKSSLYSQSPSLVTRHFDEQLSSMIPCPEEMEKRMADRGWNAPKSIDDLVSACRVMWEGLTDRARAIEGAAPTSKVPPQEVDSFWAPEVEAIESWIVSFTTSTPIVVETAAGDAVLDRLSAEGPASSTQPGQQQPEPVYEPPIPDPPPEPIEAPEEPEPVVEETIPSLEMEQVRFPSRAGADEWTAGAENVGMSATQAGAMVVVKGSVEQFRSLDKSLSGDPPAILSSTRSEPAQRQAPQPPAVPEKPAAAAEDFDFEALRSQAKDARSRKKDAKSQQKEAVSAKAAEAIAQTASFDGSVWRIDPSLLVELAQTPRKFILFGYDMSAAAFSATRIRKMLAVVSKWQPTFGWDPVRLRLQVRWAGGRGGLDLAGALPTSIRFDDTTLDVLLEPVVKPNPGQFWHDDRPWSPRWPGYPLIDDRDAELEAIKSMPWPQPRDTGPRAGCLSAGCMQLYSRWKRNGVLAGEVPPGWTPGEARGWGDQPMAHPVDIVFASLRST